MHEQGNPGLERRGWLRRATRRADVIVLGLAAGNVVAALAARAIHRSVYFPGWDIVAPSNGQFLLSTMRWSEAVRFLWYQNRHFFLPFVPFSAPFVFVPGALTMLLPWEYWAHVVSFATFVVTLALIATVARGWSVRGVAILLLAVAASPAMLSCPRSERLSNVASFKRALTRFRQAQSISMPSLQHA